MVPMTSALGGGGIDRICTVCRKTMAVWALLKGFGPLLYVLLGSRQVPISFGGILEVPDSTAVLGRWHYDIGNSTVEFGFPNKVCNKGDRASSDTSGASSLAALFC